MGRGSGKSREQAPYGKSYPGTPLTQPYGEYTQKAPGLSPQQQPGKGGIPRLSEPKGWQPFAPGGLGIMARRTTVDPLFGMTSEALQTFATSQPMRLLGQLPSIHPSVGFALWSALRLMLPIDGFEIMCHKIDGRQKGAPKIDKQALKLVKDLFESLPQEIGGIHGLAITMAIQALFTGLITVEAVPGETLKGLLRVWPVDSLTITFIRPGRNEDLEPYQKQLYPNWGTIGSGGRPYWWSTTPGGQLAAPALPPPGGTSWKGGMANDQTSQNQAQMLLGMNYVRMDKDTFFWRAVDPDVDDPYGTAPYATCLSEVLADLALMQDLRDSVHNAAWPRTNVGVDMMALHQVAVEIHRITDAKLAAQWVQDRFNEVVDYVESLNPDDNIVHHSTGKVETQQPGSFAGLQPVLQFLRQRIVQSLKTLPTLMGINDGVTPDSSVEYTIYTSGLESIRDIIIHVLEKICNLHLRLCGKKAKCRITGATIRLNDQLVSANAENVSLLNATMYEKLGYKSHEEACRDLTGHDPAGEAVPGQVEPLPQPIPGMPVSRSGSNNSVSRSSKPGGGGSRENSRPPAGRRNAGTGLGANKQNGSKAERSTAKRTPRPGMKEGIKWVAIV